MFRDDTSHAHEMICWQCAGVKEDSDKSTVRVYETTARKAYHLSLKDLEALEYQTVRNPHYASAAPSRLYDVREIEAICARKYGSWLAYWARIDARRLALTQRTEERKRTKAIEAQAEEVAARAAEAQEQLDRRAYFETTTRDQRLQELRRAGVYRNDSALCNMFIGGIVELNTSPPPSLEHVVAVMQLCSYLFDHDHTVYSNFHTSMRKFMEQRKYSHGCSWDQARQAAIEKFEPDIDGFCRRGHRYY
jgi:hypothetical protein